MWPLAVVVAKFCGSLLKCIYAICRTIGNGKISRILFNFDNHSKKFFSSIILEVSRRFFSTERQTFTIENLFLVQEYDKSSYLVIGCCKDNGFGPHQMPVSAMLIFSLLRARYIHNLNCVRISKGCSHVVVICTF